MRELAAPLAFLAVSGIYLGTALTFPLGSAARPGAGFFPAGVGAYLCALALALLVASRRRGGGAAGAARDEMVAADARGRVVATMAGLVGFCALLGWIGYPAAAFLFTAVLLKSLGGGRWPTIVAAAALAAAGSYVLFGLVLGVPLPRGILGG